MEALEAETGKDPMPPALLSTHPSHPERILKLMDAMPKALEERSRSGQVATPIIVR
jgi:Zn-dependent protease with chaperone function